MRQPASKGSGTNSPRNVEGGIDLDLRPLQGVDEVAYLLGVPRATLYRWQSLIPRGSAGTKGPPGGAVSPLQTGRRPELHRTAAAQCLVTSRCCPAAMNPTAPCPAEVRPWYGVAPEAAGPGLVPGMCASPAHDRGEPRPRGPARPRQPAVVRQDPHPADRREVVAQVLAADGIEAPDADRLAADRTLPDGDASIHVGRLRPRRHHLRRRHRRIPTPGPDLPKPVRARQDPRRAPRLTTCGRVLGSRQWSGKTLTEHRADRRAAQVLAAAGIDPGDGDQMAADLTLPDGTARYVWADVEPGEVGYVAVIAASLRQANRWRAQYDDAKQLAAQRGSPRGGPVDSHSATGRVA